MRAVVSWLGKLLPRVVTSPGCCGLAAMLIAVGGIAAAPVRYAAMPLDALGFATATALNNQGAVAGQSPEGHVIIWDGQRVRDLGFGGLPTAMNDAGDVVGYAQPSATASATDRRAFLYHDGTLIDLSPLLPSPTSEARDVNAAGVVIGNFAGPATGFFRYSQGTMTAITAAPQAILGLLHASRLNAAGQVAGYATYTTGIFEAPSTYTGFEYDAGAFSVFNAVTDSTPPVANALSSLAYGINDSGVVIGRVASGMTGKAAIFAVPTPVSYATGFVASNGRSVDLGFSPVGDDVLASAPAINNRNEIAGTFAGGKSESWWPGVWSGGVAIDLSTAVPGLAISFPQAINDRGQILAEYGAGPLYPVLLSPTALHGYLVNVSGRAVAGAGATTNIAGFTLSGGASGSLLIRVVGPSLGRFGLSNNATDPALRLYDGHGIQVAANDNWSDGAGAPDITGLADRAGAFTLPAGSRDAAVVTRLSASAYTVHASAENPGAIVLTEVYDTGAHADARLSNASVRVLVGDGENAGTLGFTVGGDGPCTVLIRAVGPALAGLGVPGVLPDPMLWLFGGNQRVLGNDDWGSATRTPLLAGSMAKAGAFALPDDSKDAALLTRVEPGSYTVQVTGKGGASGVALLEAYVLD